VTYGVPGPCRIRPGRLKQSADPAAWLVCVASGRGGRASQQNHLGNPLPPGLTWRRFIQVVESADKGEDDADFARTYKEFLREASQMELQVGAGSGLPSCLLQLPCGCQP
jgi:hypothetical protein